MNQNASLTADLKQEALRLGFDRVGVCPAVAPEGIDRFGQWLDAGYAGRMQYLSERRQAYDHPKHVLDGARSIVMLADNYRTEQPREPEKGQGRVSRYAWGDDYHDGIRARLRALGDFLRARVDAPRVRGIVDTAPLLERELAQLAGLGWIGKNTLLLNKQLGSWFFLAALLTDVELAYDPPNATDHCGTCRACLDACPTDAFVDAGVLDARKCISYLTIELQSPIPVELREGLGDWAFGCDVCQDVCPWNRRAPVTDKEEYQPKRESNPLELTSLFTLDEAGFRRRFRNTPLWRSRRRGLLRNAAIVLGNQGDPRVSGALLRGLRDDEPLVRGACAWALGRIRQPSLEAALRESLAGETDETVREEIRRVLQLQA